VGQPDALCTPGLFHAVATPRGPASGDSCHRLSRSGSLIVDISVGAVAGNGRACGAAPFLESPSLAANDCASCARLPACGDRLIGQPRTPLAACARWSGAASRSRRMRPRNLVNSSGVADCICSGEAKKSPMALTSTCLIATSLTVMVAAPPTWASSEGSPRNPRLRTISGPLPKWRLCGSRNVAILRNHGGSTKGRWLCENRSLGCRSCTPSSRFVCPRVYPLPSEGGEGDEPR
jgi:hypothetical protein